MNTSTVIADPLREKNKGCHGVTEYAMEGWGHIKDYKTCTKPQYNCLKYA